MGILIIALANILQHLFIIGGLAFFHQLFHAALGGFGAALRLDGLVVGRRAVGARLGYERGRMRGPLPVRLLAGWLRHDGRYVEWGRVRTIDPDRIVISGTVEELPRPGPSS